MASSRIGRRNISKAQPEGWTPTEEGRHPHDHRDRGLALSEAATPPQPLNVALCPGRPASRWQPSREPQLGPGSPEAGDGAAGDADLAAKPLQRDIRPGPVGEAAQLGPQILGGTHDVSGQGVQRPEAAWSPPAEIFESLTLPEHVARIFLVGALVEPGIGRNSREALGVWATRLLEHEEHCDLVPLDRIELEEDISLADALLDDFPLPILATGKTDVEVAVHFLPTFT